MEAGLSLVRRCARQSVITCRRNARNSGFGPGRLSNRLASSLLNVCSAKSTPGSNDRARVRSGRKELLSAGFLPAKIPLAVHLLESLTSVTEVQDTIVKNR